MGTEDIADEPAEVGPVHAELELLHDAGHDTHGEVDQEDFPEELRCPQPLLVVRPNPCSLHPRDEETETDRDRHEQKVVDGGDTELKPRQI